MYTSLPALWQIVSHYMITKNWYVLCNIQITLVTEWVIEKKEEICVGHYTGPNCNKWLKYNELHALVHGTSEQTDERID